MNKRFFSLVHDQARSRAIECVREAPAGYSVIVQEPTRNGEQNAKFHAICQDLAGTVWAGKPRDASAWKVLLISGHAKATHQEVDIVPGLEGEFINIRESSARMSVGRMSSLIEYASAFMAKQARDASEWRSSSEGEVDRGPSALDPEHGRRSS